MRTKRGTCLSLSPVAHQVLTRLATTWGISRSAVVELGLRHAGAALDTTVADLETWGRAQTEARRGGAAAGMDGGQGAVEHYGEAKGQDTDGPSRWPQRALRAGNAATYGGHCDGSDGHDDGPRDGQHDAHIPCDGDVPRPSAWP